MNGREADEAELILDVLPDIEQYIFCSSAGVYLKSDQMPHREEDAVDHKSRHKVRISFSIPYINCGITRVALFMGFTAIMYI